MARDKSLGIGRRGALALVAICGLPGAAASQPRGMDGAMTDGSIRGAIEESLRLDPAVPAEGVNVVVQAGRVVLGGAVDDLRARDRAAAAAAWVRGVHSVDNRIMVRQSSRTDDAIQLDISTMLAAAPSLGERTVGVAVSDGRVWLAGEVESWPEKRLAGEVARRVRGVVAVENELRIRYGRARTDSAIASEIGQRLQADARLDADQIGVEVEDGRVELTGEVGSALERGLATTAALVDGVRSVNEAPLRVGGRREPEQPLRSDGAIRRAVQTALSYQPWLVGRQPTVEVQRGRVTLTGVVQTLRGRDVAERAAQVVAGVRRVDNQLAVMPPREVNPVELAERVNVALRSDPVLSRRGFDFGITDGEVTISGRVETAGERDLVEELLSSVVGVTAIDNQVTPLRSPLIWSDQQIAKDIERQLAWNPLIDPSELQHLQVTVRNGVATIRGRVRSLLQAQMAERSAHRGGAEQVRLAVRPTG